MAVLLDLPTELLRHVVSYLDQDLELDDLLSLSLTNKRIHSVTAPSLYRVFSLEDRYRRFLYNDVGSGRISKLIRLITTLNHRPELARHFREATFIGEASGLDSADLDFVEGDTVEEILKCLMRVTPESSWRHLLASIAKADINPFVLMICATVSKLECVSLILQDDFEWLEPLFLTVAGYDNSPYLASLKKIHITGKYHMAVAEIHEVQHVLRLPGLKRFCLSDISVVGQESLNWNIVPRSLSIEVIEFSHVRLPRLTFLEIVMGCQQLRDLWYYDHAEEGFFETPWIGPDVLAEILTSQKSFLKAFVYVLTCEGPPPLISALREELPAFEALFNRASGFTRLRELTIRFRQDLEPWEEGE